MSYACTSACNRAFMPMHADLPVTHIQLSRVRPGYLAEFWIDGFCSMIQPYFGLCLLVTVGHGLFFYLLEIVMLLPVLALLPIIYLVFQSVWHYNEFWRAIEDDSKTPRARMLRAAGMFAQADVHVIDLRAMRVRAGWGEDLCRGVGRC